MTDWLQLTFAEAPLQIIDGDRGTNYPSQSDFMDIGYCLFLNAGNVTINGFNFSTRVFIDRDRDLLLRKGKLQRFDTVLTTRGTVGNAAFFDNSVPYEHVRINSGMVIIRPEPESILPRYLYLFIRSAMFAAQVSALTTGSAQPQLPIRDIQKIRIPLPPMREQHAIASLLGALDDKIELNRRMNETLETMARAIFKDWFVDFGPTRAKMKGVAPYLAKDIWSLFPDRLDDGGKPEGWITSNIGQEVEVVGGSTPSTKEPAFWGGDICWATPKDLASLSTPVLLSTERQITDAGLTQIGSGLLPIGTVLLSSRAPIGYMAIAQIPVAVNQGFIAMICNKRISNVFAWLWAQANMDTVHQNANGSTFQEISKANFRPIEVTIATTELLRTFDEMARPLFDRIVANEKENLTLAATRDFLLPKLMSGEIRVGDAASFV